MKIRSNRCSNFTGSKYKSYAMIEKTDQILPSMLVRTSFHELNDKPWQSYSSNERKYIISAYAFYLRIKLARHLSNTLDTNARVSRVGLDSKSFFELTIIRLLARHTYLRVSIRRRKESVRDSVEIRIHPLEFSGTMIGRTSLFLPNLNRTLPLYSFNDIF